MAPRQSPPTRHAARPGEPAVPARAAADRARPRAGTAVRAAAARPARRPPSRRPPAPSRARTPTGAHRRRVRDRLARRLTAGPAPVRHPAGARAAGRDPPGRAPEGRRPAAAAGYDVAEERHRGQLRKCGDPYITHPLAVATILAELGMDTTTLVAALLHDTVEDTGYTLEDVTREFGAEVAHLVDGVTKLDKVKYGDAAEAETIRKMIVAMARDPRVLVIKLADRLHNMRTLRFLPPDKQERKARETLEVLAPLAHRLGMNTVKWELEDLAFATLYPKRYDEIVRLVAERAPSRDTYLAEVDRAGHRRPARRPGSRPIVTGRPKHYYSIYQKMIVRGRDFTDIYDLVGIRVLVDSVRDCYATLGVIHANWQPVPGRFKDYIAMPKFNMYQSLHTTVIGPEGKPVELQIRTQAMHRTAEYGIAAHWKYKETKDGKPAPASSGRRGRSPTTWCWLRQLLDWQREAQEPGEFLDSLRFDLGAREVFVFTPKGDVIALPTGSTPVDFAYAVHTEVGHRCIGARVNGRLVALESRSTTATRRDLHLQGRAAPARPGTGWRSSARRGPRPRSGSGSPRSGARTRSRPARTRSTRAMRKAGLPLQRLLGGDALITLARDLHYADVTALYAAVGEGHVSAQSVVQKLVTSLGGAEGAVEDIAETAIPTRRRRRGAGRPATPASWSRASPTSGSSWPGAARRCPATTSSASSPAAAACRCTARPAPTPAPC